MRYEKKRCKYCGHIYYYQSSGEGCFEPTNDDTYCHRCKAIINKALAEQVPKEDKITHFPKESEKFSDNLLKTFEEIKNDFQPQTMFVSCPLEFDNIDIFSYKRNKYYICWNNDNIDDKHYYIDYEYCQSTREYKREYEFLNCRSDIHNYSKGCNLYRQMLNFYSQNKINEVKIELPKGKPLFYTWDVLDNINSEREDE